MVAVGSGWVRARQAENVNGRESGSVKVCAGTHQRLFVLLDGCEPLAHLQHVDGTVDGASGDEGASLLDAQAVEALSVHLGEGDGGRVRVRVRVR